MGGSVATANIKTTIITNGSHNDFFLKGNIACKKHIADLALIASRFSHALLQKNYTRKAVSILLPRCQQQQAWRKQSKYKR